jgi:MFS family permease
MKERLSVCLGIACVMALSNAIVPVLPAYSSGPAIQSMIYSSYFLGAFLMTLPAGLLSDRYGRVPVMRAGLMVTVMSGLLLIVFSLPTLVIVSRFLEGIGAGLFVAAGMAHVNSLPDHAKMSGYFMAALNLGLVLGLVIGGVLAAHFHVPVAGILLFTILALIPASISVSLVEPPVPQARDVRILLGSLLSKYRWLWYSAVVLVGITGVVTALYPEYSGASPDLVGIWIAGMSIATIIAVIVSSRLSMAPVPTIQFAAVFMVGGVMLSFFSPAGFLVIGALAGVVMIAQMAFLAQVNGDQGAAMGLLSTTSYLGMSVLPFIAGQVAETTTFFIAFCLTALASLSVAFTIGRCTCGRMGTP